MDHIYPGRMPAGALSHFSPQESSLKKPLRLISISGNPESFRNFHRDIAECSAAVQGKYADMGAVRGMHDA